jgi:hypothetical protein
MSLFGSIAREFKGADGLTWGEISTLWPACSGLINRGPVSRSAG